MDNINIHNQFDNEDIHIEPSMEKQYLCTNYVRSCGFTLLMKLVLLTNKNKDAVTLIKKIINQDQNIIDKKNSSGYTALMLAIANSYTCSTENTVKILVDAGANVNLQNKCGVSTLGFALSYDKNNIFEMLINAGINTNLQNKDGKTVLMGAAHSKDAHNIEKIKILLRACANVNLQDTSGRTALMYASECYGCDSKTIIQLLIDAGADVNLQDTSGWTALMYACKNNYKTKIIVQLLIDVGADINLQNKDGDTALIILLKSVNWEKYNEKYSEKDIYCILKTFTDAKFNSKNIKKGCYFK